MPTDHDPAASFRRRLAIATRRTPALLLVVAMLLPAVVHPIDWTSLGMARIDGAGWSAEDLRIDVDLSTQPLSAQLHVARVRLAGGEAGLESVDVDCRALDLSGDRMVCDDARIAGVFDVLGRQSVRGRVRYDRGRGLLEVEVAGLAFGDGTADAAVSLASAGWQGEIRLGTVPLTELLRVAKRLGLHPPELALAAGRISGRLQMRGRASRLHALDAELDLRDIAAANDVGTVAGEAMSIALQGRVAIEGDVAQVEGQLLASAGQAYVEPVFVDLSAHPLRLGIHGEFANGLLRLDSFDLNHDGVLEASGRAEIVIEAGPSLSSLDLAIGEAFFPQTYLSYLQPFLVGTSLQSLETAGSASARVRVIDSTLAELAVALDSLRFEDEATGLGLDGLSGNFHWQAAAPAEDVEAESEPSEPAAELASRLNWTGGRLYGLELGAATIVFRAAARDFRLLEPTRIPLIDGAVVIDRLRARNVGAAGMAFVFDADIEPLSVRELCRAFGWPEFGGRLAGRISRLRMREGVVTLGTNLEAEVFDGRIRLRDLRLEDPLGNWPRFSASIDVESLDLEQLTSAFSFGRITGKLSGRIDGLSLFNWTPVAFDAHLGTPPDDRSRHRISQRAVENIGSLGGSSAGVSAALSSGFLRFFDDFNYDRLGISCRLANEICYMDGIEPAENNGYYLVKGKGLPRIDVIGNTHRVDWPRLVAQLKAIIESEGPVVE